MSTPGRERWGWGMLLRLFPFAGVGRQRTFLRYSKRLRPSSTIYHNFITAGASPRYSLRELLMRFIVRRDTYALEAQADPAAQVT